MGPFAIRFRGYALYSVNRNWKRLGGNMQPFLIPLVCGVSRSQANHPLHCSKPDKVRAMDNKEGKPAKAWYVNWLIIAGTIIVIMMLS